MLDGHRVQGKEVYFDATEGSANGQRTFGGSGSSTDSVFRVSYDILAFEPTAVKDDEFSAWWDHQSQWSEAHGYDKSEVASPALQAFYTDLIREFPPLNGPDAPSAEQLDENRDLEMRLTDYSIGASLVYAAFAWSEAETAREAFLRIAQAHGVAVAMVGDDGKIIRP